MRWPTQTAHDYYEVAKENLGTAFVDRVEEALRKIQRHPELPQEIAPGLRHMRLKKFDAYAVWYLAATELLVLGCVHGKLNIPRVTGERRKILES